MKPIKLILTIEAINASAIQCYAVDSNDIISYFSYYPGLNRTDFSNNNKLTDILIKNKFQLEKVMLSASKRKIKVGQKINCVFITDFNFLNESDYNQFIRLDRRNGILNISSSPDETKDICKLYADGSFASESFTSGYGIIIDYNDGQTNVINQSFTGGSSNLMELKAVQKGLKQLIEFERIQVNTDSRYVIRGMVQWMHFWKYNNWQTASGSEVKFAEVWKDLNAITDGKLIEFKWIKGHSGHTLQDFCHILAKESAITIQGNNKK
ncbi:ribonuclease H family protein [Carboxylicivirga caseinilyticus]|uniref:ribonuclease H family protein n=1 Tax=Carboxylicivirga caseinilyticus TaxID=3417572 RepID=UPI003D32D2B0|nr:ribonuclease HI [Marinilabiliaceae bacterium A049]